MTKQVCALTAMERLNLEMTSAFPPARARILIVDDDEDIRDALRQVLEDEGYDIETAVNGLEALRILRSTPPPSLILLDLMMPVLNGFEFQAAKARDAALASIPVIVVTASLNAKAHAKSLAPIAILEKPIRLNELLDAVARYAPLPPATMLKR